MCTLADENNVNVASFPFPVSTYLYSNSMSIMYQVRATTCFVDTVGAGEGAINVYTTYLNMSHGFTDPVQNQHPRLHQRLKPAAIPTLHLH
jgi:hypothetical protein